MTTPEQNQAEAFLRDRARRFIKNGTQDEYDALINSYSIRRLKLRPERVRAILQEIIEERKSENKKSGNQGSKTETRLPSKQISSFSTSTSIPTQNTGEPSQPNQNQPAEPTSDQSLPKNSVTESTNRIIGTTAQQTATAKSTTSSSTTGSSDDANQPTSGGRQSDTTTSTTAPGSASSSSTAPTSMPPKSAEYFQHLQEYEDAYFEAMRRGELPLNEEANARLRKLIKDYDLSNNDVAASNLKATQRFLDSSSSSNQTEPASPDGSSQEKPHSASILPPDLLHLGLFEQLEKDLKNKNYKNADAVTFDILQRLINPSQSWLDRASLENFSRPVEGKEQQAIHEKAQRAIQEMDRLWTHYSDRFGFSLQLGIYESVKAAVRANSPLSSADDRQNRLYALEFSKAVGWWINRLEFLAPYHHLNFTDTALIGHLPALWFWEMPWLVALGQGGICLPWLRGGYRADTRINQFMEMLQRCGIKPIPLINPVVTVKPMGKPTGKPTGAARNAGTAPAKKGVQKKRKLD